MDMLGGQQWIAGGNSGSYKKLMVGGGLMECLEVRNSLAEEDNRDSCSIYCVLSVVITEKYIFHAGSDVVACRMPLSARGM